MRRIDFLRILFATALITVAGCGTPQGIGDSLGLDPYSDWKTIETDHFKVTFPTELGDVANRSANYLEEAHAALSPKLLWTPREKTQVLVVDNGDAANGLTTPVGRLGMIFFVTPPDNWFSTAYYDDWLRLLVIHEYTHFLNMDVSRDYAGVLRKFLGDVVLPNSLWPSWMLEGMAVYMETRLTRGGRGRSPLYEMILRAAVDADVLDTDAFITLDRVNGNNPYYPAGETAYLFGYGLMSQIGRKNETHLGELSWSSGGRLPFLLNGNLEQVAGQNWYATWNDWMQEARERTRAQLVAIRAQGATLTRPMTRGGRQTLGSSVSPDGRWLAFTQETNEKRLSLWLQDLNAGEAAQPVLATEKILGATHAFTPDSKAVIHSSLHRSKAYTLFSDLAVYDLESGTTEWLTEGLRARDPDVSPDGKFVVFTLTRKATTGIAVAPLELTEGRYRLGATRILFMPEQYDASYTPKFLKDGKSVVFSVHRNGRVREDLVAVDVESGTLRELVVNDRFNRFPAVHPSGELYFISDATGIDNVYRYREGAAPLAVTNVTTGLTFPSFSPTGRLFANVFSYTGWDLAEVEGFNSTLSVQPAPIAPPPVPLADAESDPNPVQKDYAIGDYSPLASLWPRQWAPFFLLSPSGAVFGGEVMGFDAIDRHRYFAAVTYDTMTSKADAVLYYANRSLGPTLSFQVDDRTTDTYFASLGTVSAYIRKTKYTAAVSYPFRWTYSSLTPALAINTERSSLFQASGDGFAVTANTRYVPSVDAYATFSNTESSALAITAEQGRSTQVGVRTYMGLEPTVLKGLVKDTEYLHLGSHSVLIPSVKWSWVSDLTNYAPAAVNVRGRANAKLTTGLPGDSFDQLALRGYANQSFYAKSAGVFSLDYRFPLLRIYRGWGTNPAYLDHLYGFTFTDVGFFPGREPGYSLLGSVGAGVRLSGELLIHLPLLISLEVDRGLNSQAGGGAEVILQVGVGGLSF